MNSSHPRSSEGDPKGRFRWTPPVLGMALIALVLIVLGGLGWFGRGHSHWMRDDDQALSLLGLHLSLDLIILFLALLGLALLVYFVRAYHRELLAKRMLQEQFLGTYESLRRQRQALEDRLLNLAEVAPGALFTFRRLPDGTPQFPYVSPGMEKYMGISTETLMANALELSARIHPEDLSGFRQSIVDSGRSMGLWQQEFRMHHPERGEIWVEGRSMPVKDSEGTLLWHGFFTDITERKRAEEEHRQQAARLHSIIDAAPFGAHSYRLEKDGILVFVGFNRAADRILGVSHQDFVGKPVEEVFPEFAASPFADEYRKVAATGLPFDAEVPYTSSDILGTFEVHAFQTSPDQMTAFFRDITERKKVEDVLARERVFTNAVLDSVPGLLYLYDAEGHLIRWNKQHEVITGYSAEELSRMCLADWYWGSPVDMERIGKAVQRALDEGYAEEDGSLLTKSGNHILFHFTAVRLEIEGKIYFAGIGIDITAKRKAEEEILRLNESLEEKVNQRTSELKAANRELESFSYSVSHDLRAPLRAMDGFSLALLEDYGDSLDPTARHYVAEIREGARRMNALIEDLLRLSRTGRSELNWQTVDMHSLVCGVAAELGIPALSPKVEFRMVGPDPCQGDPSLLKQVWANLLSNAVKYSAKNESALIEVGSELWDEETTYFVRDNGVGFDMKYADKLFKVFQRLHSPGEFEGNGVGLALVRQIVTRHGGRVWAESAPGQGACFRFTLAKTVEGSHE